MKKNILLVLLVLLIFTGCTKEKIQKKEIKPAPQKETVIKYEDNNTTPIGIYKLNGNTLNKITTLNKTLAIEEIVDTFQIFPATEDSITLTNSFGSEFYNKWKELNPNNTIKIGFNIKYKKTSGEEVSYIILGPGNTMDEWEYLMNYLYDDYANQGKGFYSHLEEKDMTNNTLFTTFKMQASYSSAEVTNIKFTVFTYDTEDDFENNEYRGKSSDTINICIDKNEC